MDIPIPRLDSLEKVSGRAIYAGDMSLPDLLYGKILRSAVPHAKIASIDVGRARNLPGVKAVLTFDDVKHLDARLGTYVKDQPLLAFEKIRYSGEPIAAVAAETELMAEQAIALIDVRYEDLPPVVGVESALAPQAVLVHEGLKDYEVRGAKPVAGTNIVHVGGFEVGDVDAAFRLSDVSVENEFRFPMVYHYSLEPHAAIARYDVEGITIWSATQSPFSLRDTVARIFRLPVNRVRVIVPYVGGGFGSKSQSYALEPMAAALSLKTGRPVKIKYSVTEAMQTTRRLAMHCRIRTAAKRDGTLVARDCVLHMDNGAYAMIGPSIADKAANRVIGPYRYPNLRVKVYAVYTNTTPAGSFRAVGAPQAVWAGESQMDVLAEKLNLDPLEFRRRNILRRGESPRPGMRALDGDLKEMLDKAAKAIGWEKASPAPNRAKGMAMALSDPGAAPPSIALARFNYDGSLTILTGSAEIGQGSRTVLSQIAAAEMAIPLEKVLVVPTDTLTGPFDPRTSSSRTTIVNGSAVCEAVRDVKRQLLAMAAKVWQDKSKPLRWSEGKISDGLRSVPPEDVVRQIFREGGEVIGQGVMIPGSGIDEGSARPMFYESCVGMTEVEVDPDTGQIKILKYVGASDIGKAINLAQCEGREEGAVVQGIGHTLFEQMVYDNGVLLNDSLVDYRVPNFLDVPQEQETLFIENLDGPGPGGAKGMGEGGIIPVAAAIGNALTKITGVRVRELPLTPERVWQAAIASEQKK